MVNQEHVDILKQGVAVWNQWRKEHSDIPDLRAANLSGADLREVNLDRAYLMEANLREANFFKASLRSAFLFRARLKGAYFRDADLYAADFSGADLTNTILIGADLREAKFDGAYLTNAYVGRNIVGDVDLSGVKELETVKHKGPSTIGIDTIYRSKGNIPEIFLKGAGVPDSMIDYMRSLVGKPIEYYTCFISYSSRDQEFAERLYADLQSKGVRCSFAPEDLKIGEKFWHRIDESIRLHDKLLVILSEHSVASTWVEHEVMAALEKERQHNKLVLFPIKLDETVMQTNLPWAASLRRERHIGDFTKWKNHDDYQKSFSRLLRDLKAAYQ